MKKLVLLCAFLVFLLTFWIGITYVIGNKAKGHYLALLEESSQFGFVSFTNTNYQRGFMQSRAETLVEIKINGTESSEEEVDRKLSPVLPERIFHFVLEHDIFHGPFPTSEGPVDRYGSGPAIALVETRLKHFTPDPDGLDNLLNEIPELRNSIQIARIRIDGKIDSFLEIPAFDYQYENSTISYGGLKAETIYSLANGAMSGTFQMKNIALSASGKETLTWNGLSGEFDYERPLPMIYVGFSRISLGSMNMQFRSTETGQFEEVNMKEMIVTSNSNYDGKMVNIAQNTTFDGIFIQDDLYGPLKIDIELKNIDGKALSDFQRQVIDLYREYNSFDPDRIAAAILPLYFDLIKQLLAGDPEINIREFSLNTPYGRVEGEVKTKITGIKNVSFNDPAALIQHLKNVESIASLSIDELLLRTILREQARKTLLLMKDSALSETQVEAMAQQQSDQQLEMMIAENLILREGEKLKSFLSLKQGELTLNGQILPFFKGVR